MSIKVHEHKQSQKPSRKSKEKGEKSGNINEKRKKNNIKEG